MSAAVCQCLHKVAFARGRNNIDIQYLEHKTRSYELLYQPYLTANSSYIFQTLSYRFTVTCT